MNTAKDNAGVLKQEASRPAVLFQTGIKMPCLHSSLRPLITKGKKKC